MRGTEGERVVNESRIDHYSTFSPVQQVGEIPKVAVTASNAVAGTIFIQNKYLTRWKPTLFGLERNGYYNKTPMVIIITKENLQVNKKGHSIENQELMFEPLWKTENGQIWRDPLKCTLPCRVYELGRYLHNLHFKVVMFFTDKRMKCIVQPPWILAMVELFPDGVKGGAGLCDWPVAL